ncbi:general secretion pathway protein GspK [bacterium]|nr:general secretion pathway protein GspK [bacterium]
MKRKSQKNSGVILIFVMVIVLAISTMVLFFQSSSKGYISLFSSSLKSVNMDYLAESGIQIGQEIIKLQQQRESTSILADKNWPKEKIFELEDLTLSLTIKDENACINPNKIFGDEKGEIDTNLQRVFDTFFVAMGYSSVLKDSLLDWIDEDDIPRQDGAESFYYRTEGLSYAPSNRHLYSENEILLIRDFNKDILFGKEGTDEEEEVKGLINFISILSDGKINVNRCLPEILNAMGFTSANVDAIVTERERRPLDEIILSGINREVYEKNRSVITFQSNYYSITSKVSNEEGYIKEIKAYIYIDNKSTHILRWNVI